MKRQTAATAALRTREISRERKGVWNTGDREMEEERRHRTAVCVCVRESMCVFAEGGGGWRGWCFLCHRSPILSPENVTLPLGGSAPRRDSSVWPHLPRCSVARARGAWEASHCTLSDHQHPSHWLSHKNLQRTWSFSHKSAYFWKAVMHLYSYFNPEQPRLMYVEKSVMQFASKMTQVFKT